MPRANLKQASRLEWEVDSPPDVQWLQVGCMQRMADSMEVMSKRYLELLDAVERRGRRIESLTAEAEAKDRTIAGLRGTITRMKREAATTEGAA